MKNTDSGCLTVMTVILNDDMVTLKNAIMLEISKSYLKNVVYYIVLGDIWYTYFFIMYDLLLYLFLGEKKVANGK